MYLNALKLTNYKNYTTVHAVFNKPVVIFSGQNGTGKTNILDAIYQLSFCKSNFQHRDSLLVKRGEDLFRIEGRYDHQGDPHKAVIKYAGKTKKEIEFDGKKLSKISDHVGKIPLVFIGPRDIQLFFDGSAERRRFLDSGLCQIDKHYLNNLVIYNRILGQRNSYLKSTTPQTADFTLIQSYDEQLQQVGQTIYEKRMALVNRLSDIFNQVYKSISNDKEAVSCTYSSQLDIKPLGTLLKESREKDLFLQRTTQGIHKDELIFKLNDHVLKQFGSEGQLKTFLLSLKLSMWELIKNETSKQPILLLDDIFAKLDVERVKNLLSYIQQTCDTQIFISDTDRSRVSNILDSLALTHTVFHIANNQIEVVHEA